MRRPAGPVAPPSKTEKLARKAVALPLPPGMSPLRVRLLRLCLTPDGGPCPEKLAALRDMSLKEALELEQVAQHRQREALHLQDVIREEAEREEARKRRGTRR